MSQIFSTSTKKSMKLSIRDGSLWNNNNIERNFTNSNKRSYRQSKLMHKSKVKPETSHAQHPWHCHSRSSDKPNAEGGKRTVEQIPRAIYNNVPWITQWNPNSQMHPSRPPGEIRMVKPWIKELRGNVHPLFKIKYDKQWDKWRSIWPCRGKIALGTK